MRKTVVATIVALCLMFVSAFAVHVVDGTQVREGETLAQDGRSKTCPLPDGAEFVFHSGGADVGKHDVRHSGHIQDAFAYALSVKYRSRDFTTALPSYSEDRPDCVNYATSGNVVYALTDNAIFRFMSANGRSGGSVLFVSRDGGHSFSDNIHPNALEKAQGNPEIHGAFAKFGYYRSRFRILGEQYQLEITDPLNYNQFLLFVSADGGSTWTGSASSANPTVYPVSEVEKWRNEFAENSWHNKKFNASNEACRLRAEAGCAAETDEYWGVQWQPAAPSIRAGNA